MTMSSKATSISIPRVSVTGKEGYFTVAEYIRRETSFTKKRAKDIAIPTAYPAFIWITTVTTVFFAISLVLSLTSQYFLDWGSALIGLLGAGGLALVGQLSKRQIRNR